MPVCLISVCIGDCVDWKSENKVIVLAGKGSSPQLHDCWLLVKGTRNDEVAETITAFANQEHTLGIWYGRYWFDDLISGIFETFQLPIPTIV
jgi:hypothetical protein